MSPRSTRPRRPASGREEDVVTYTPFRVLRRRVLCLFRDDVGVRESGRGGRVGRTVHPGDGSTHTLSRDCWDLRSVREDLGRLEVTVVGRLVGVNFFVVERYVSEIGPSVYPPSGAFWDSGVVTGKRRTKGFPGKVRGVGFPCKYYRTLGVVQEIRAEGNGQCPLLTRLSPPCPEDN